MLLGTSRYSRCHRGDNAALLALQIRINNPAIAAAVVEYREMRTNAVIADDKALQEERSAE